MNIWSQVPFFRLLFPFAVGILTQIYLECFSEFLGYVLYLLFFLCTVFLFVKPLHISYAHSAFFGVLIMVSLFLSGMFITVLHTGKFSATHFGKFTEKAEMYLARTAEPYLEKEKSFKTELEILAVKSTGRWIKTTGRAIFYFKKDSLSAKIQYGDLLLVKTKFSEVKEPQNPGEFNYKRYLSFHGIYHQAYLAPQNWKPVGINEGNPVVAASYWLREYLLSIYKKNGLRGNELSVASALVLGFKDYLDQDLLNAYASAGAIHVLAVSGLHVGIIFVIASNLLFFLTRVPHGRIMRAVILLFVLWFYALLTGLSPSVLRACTMFSFVVIAQATGRHTNIFNTLAVSCFVLLLYNPYLLMEVGFQLSYLAVLGIVSIQPWLYEKWQPSSWLLDKIWVIISVSIGAQAATFPLGLLYFHQFPNYFLFSNLIVIPAATLILCTGIVLFVAGAIPYFGELCTYVFSFIVRCLNFSVQTIDKIPFAKLEGISISVAETWFIYFSIACLLFFISFRQLKYFFASLCLVLSLLLAQAIEKFNQMRQHIFIVYNVPKHSAYDFISGKKTIFLADLQLLNSPDKMIFHIKHNWSDKGVTHPTFLERGKEERFSNKIFFMQKNFLVFQNKKIGWIDSLPDKYIAVKQKLPLDLLILSKNAKVKISELQNKFDFKKIIIDSSNSQWKNEQWKKECAEFGVACYSVIDSGAYVENL